MSNAKFLPPKQNPLLTRLIQSIFYLVTYFAYQIKLETSDRDLAILKDLDDKRVVLLANHSNLDDGLVMFLLSARLGQLFNYIVAYEAFQGIIGWLMQHVGAYSLRRGVGDRPSIVQTLKILQQPKCKLVIFPEGGCSYQNDTTIPFRTGAGELAFKTLTKLSKQENTTTDLYFVPVSIKYIYPKNSDRILDKSLQDLEIALSIEPTTNDFYIRLRAIAAKVLTNIETEYQIVPKDLDDWNQRIADLKKQLLNYCENQLEIATSDRLSNRDRVYKIQAVLTDLKKSEPESNLDYRQIELTAIRLLNFDAIYDGYVADKPTPERFFATLDRLEREVFQIDRPRSKGMRRVRVKIATPIDVREYWLNNQQQIPTAIA